MQNMHSHRSETCPILSVLLFIHEYSKYFSLQINSKITIYCDNKESVTKIDNIRGNVQHYDLNCNLSNHEAIIGIKTYLPNRYEIVHLHSHQDKILSKGYNVVINFARTPLNINIPFIPLAVYFDNQCIANKYTRHVRRLEFQKNTNEFIKW